MGFLAFALFMGLLFCLEWVQISRHGGGRGELIAFSVLMVVGFILGGAMLLGVSLPNPTKFLEALFQPLTLDR